MAGRTLPQPHRVPHGINDASIREERATPWVTLTRKVPTSGDEVGQRAHQSAIFTEVRQHVAHVVDVRSMRSHEQQPILPLLEARIGVQEIRGAVQSNDRLSGSRPTINHQRAIRRRADDRVLVSLNRRENIAHLSRAMGAEGSEQGRPVVPAMFSCALPGASGSSQ